MGARNPDRIFFAEYAAACPTAGKMRAARWNLRIKCKACGLTMAASLDTIVKARGGDYRLWGVAVRCKDLACIDGMMTFWASPPGSGAWNELRKEWDPARRANPAPPP